MDNNKYSILGQDEKIVKEQEYLNEVLSAVKGNEKELSYEQVEDIMKIVNNINSLEKKGINKDTFSHKAKSYKKHLKNMSEDFNFNPNNMNLSFNRPTDLKIKLDNLLQSYSLNNEQIRDITRRYFGKTARRPKEKFIKPLLTTYINKDGRISFKNIPEHITPLVKEEYYNNQKQSDDDEVNLNIKITRGELKILKNYIQEEYGDYYYGGEELYLKDLVTSIIEELQKSK